MASVRLSCRRLATSCDAPGGNANPMPTAASNPATPDSATLGTFGTTGDRLRVVTAISRIFPFSR